MLRLKLNIFSSKSGVTLVSPLLPCPQTGLMYQQLVTDEYGALGQE